MLREDKLDFWYNHGYNIMFIGRHGVGKTAMIKDCFQRNGLVIGETFLYFSSSTLDPWVDLVGVPKEKTGEDGVTYLDLVRPRPFAYDNVEAIFFDEFNRSPKKVRNAVMELLQFKSINGKRFSKLKAVWAAINPDDDDEYDVEKIDPAQKDRFHIQIEVPYLPSMSWFSEKYGERLAKAAIHWWNELPDEEKKKVSPRRLEYALQMHADEGEIRDVLPYSSNVGKLKDMLKTGPAAEKITKIFQDKDISLARLFLANENNYNSGIRVITESDALMDFFLPLVNKEKLIALISTSDRACRFVCSRGGANSHFQQVMKDVLLADTNKKLVKRIRKSLSENQRLTETLSTGSTSTVAPAHYNKTPTLTTSWSNQLTTMKAEPKDTTPQRMKIYHQIVTNIPEKMTSEEALETLSLFDDIIQRCWTSTLASNSMKLLPNIINHCIAQLAAGTGLGWTEILSRYGSRMKYLLEKMRDTGLAAKLFTPSDK